MHVIRTLIDSYAGQAFDIHWRVWLNDRLTRDWLGARAYYPVSYTHLLHAQQGLQR